MATIEPGRARHRVVLKACDEALWLPARRSWFGAMFLCLWLTVWVSGGLSVIARPANAMTIIMLLFWLFGAIGAILFTIGQITGADIVSIRDGELTIMRRAGPFHRRWRYATGRIANLRVDLSPWSGDGADGAQHLPFVRQQWGTVRFDYGFETVHLAPGLDAPEAAAIHERLRRRLPASASGATGSDPVAGE